LLFISAAAEQLAAFSAVLSSLTLDYIARQKVGGTHLTYGFLNQFAIPHAIPQHDLEFIVPRVLELTYTSHSMRPFAEDLGYSGPPFAWNEERRALLRAELDAKIARLYGLDRNQLRYILDPEEVMGKGYPSETFRVLKKNEVAKYGEYRTRRLVLDAWDRMERGDSLEYSPPIAIPAYMPPDLPVSFPAEPLFIGDGAWAMPSYSAANIQAQLAALIKALPGPTPIERVCLAALYALEPRYLTKRLSGAARESWLKRIGPTAAVAGTNVTILAPRINAAFRDAATTLIGIGAIVVEAGIWSAGSAIDEFHVDTDETMWPYGRARFVLQAMEHMKLADEVAELPAEDRAWVGNYAAA
jgi:hypothetical protein